MVNSFRNSALKAVSMSRRQPVLAAQPQFQIGVRLFNLVSVLANTQYWIPAEERK